jgi:putative oxidoreductase
MRRGVNPDLGLTILRVVLGVIFIAHGAPKLFGGMEGFSGFLGSLGIPIPLLFAWLVALLEFFGGISLVIGFLVTPLALLLAAEMLVAIILVHAERGFYVVGAQANGGIEFNLLLMAALVMLVFGGPGMVAIDSRTETV